METSKTNLTTTDITTVNRAQLAGRAAQRPEPAGSSARPSVFGLLRLNWQARLAEGATEAELRILDCQLRLIEKRHMVAGADLQARTIIADMERAAYMRELEGRREATDLARQADEAEAERALLASVRQAAPEQARRIVGADMETQRLLLEREQLRRERLAQPPAATNVALALPAPVEPVALEVHVSDRQIETLAVRALTRFAGLPPDEADRRWEQWRRELHVRLPPYAAAEVERRANELRGLSE